MMRDAIQDIVSLTVVIVVIATVVVYAGAM